MAVPILHLHVVHQELGAAAVLSPTSTIIGIRVQEVVHLHHMVLLLLQETITVHCPCCVIVVVAIAFYTLLSHTVHLLLLHCQEVRDESP